MLFLKDKNNIKEITAIHYGEKVIASLHKGSVLVWQAIRSCFGKGFWINEKPWINGDGWKND